MAAAKAVSMSGSQESVLGLPASVEVSGWMILATPGVEVNYTQEPLQCLAVICVLPVFLFVLLYTPSCMRKGCRAHIRKKVVVQDDAVMASTPSPWLVQRMMCTQTFGLWGPIVVTNGRSLDSRGYRHLVPVF
jgi:hypothetical protein